MNGVVGLARPGLLQLGTDFVPDVFLALLPATATSTSAPLADITAAAVVDVPAATATADALAAAASAATVLTVQTGTASAVAAALDVVTGAIVAVPTATAAQASPLPQVGTEARVLVLNAVAVALAWPVIPFTPPRAGGSLNASRGSDGRVASRAAVHRAGSRGPSSVASSR